jgi:hypothetical protein
MSSSAHQRSGSASEKRSSTNQSRNTTSASGAERRTERTSRLTRETITVRTKSPLKPTSESRVNGKRSRDVETPVGRGEGAKKAEEKSGSCCTCILGLRFDADYRSSEMDPAGFHNRTHDRTLGLEDIRSPTRFHCPSILTTATTKSADCRRAGEGNN